MAENIPKTMKAILVKDGKGAEGGNQHYDPSTKPVLVKVYAFGLNRMDILQREGTYPLPPSASQILGVEFSGTIADPGGSDWKVGDHVFGLATGGAYAEYISVPTKMVLPKPKELSWEQAAAIPENFLTAYQALTLLSSLQKGEDVLVHAGASGVGLAAIQIAKTIGARNVYVTAGSEDKIRFCESVGATRGINYKACDWASELEKITGGAGVNVIMDFIGAPYFSSNLRSLQRDGRLVLQGFMGGSKCKDLDIGALLFKRLKVEGSTLRSRSLAYQSELVQSFVNSGYLDQLVDGVLNEKKDDKGHHLAIHKVYTWKEIQAAHQEMEQNKNTGKIVVTVD